MVYKNITICQQSSLGLLRNVTITTKPSNASLGLKQKWLLDIWLPRKSQQCYVSKAFWTNKQFTQTCEISIPPYLKEAAFRSRTNMHDICADYNIPRDCSTQKPSLQSYNNRHYALHPHYWSISIRFDLRAIHSLQLKEFPNPLKTKEKKYFRKFLQKRNALASRSPAINILISQKSKKWKLPLPWFPLWAEHTLHPFPGSHEFAKAAELHPNRRENNPHIPNPYDRVRAVLQ